MAIKYKCPRCEWAGTEEEMVDNFENGEDEWGRYCEEGSYYSCPKCGQPLTQPWDFSRIDEQYRYEEE